MVDNFKYRNKWAKSSNKKLWRFNSEIALLQRLSTALLKAYVWSAIFLRKYAHADYSQYHMQWRRQDLEEGGAER